MLCVEILTFLSSSFGFQVSSCLAVSGGHTAPVPFGAVRRANSSGCLSTVMVTHNPTVTVTGSNTSLSLSTPGVNGRAVHMTTSSHVSRGGESCPERSFSAPSLNSHSSVPETRVGLGRKKEGEKGRETKSRHGQERGAMSLKDITPPLNACRLNAIRQPGSRSAVVSSLFAHAHTHTHSLTLFSALLQVSILKGGEVCLEFPLNKHRTQDPSEDERSHLATRAVGEILLVSANGMDVSGDTFSCCCYHQYWKFTC